MNETHTTDSNGLEREPHRRASSAHIAAAGAQVAFKHFHRGDFSEAAKCFGSVIVLGAKLTPTELAVYALCLCKLGQHERARSARDLAAEILTTLPENAAPATLRRLLLEVSRALDAAEKADQPAPIDLLTLRTNTQGSPS